MRELSNDQIAERIISIDLKERENSRIGIIEPALMKRKNNLIEIGKRKGFVEGFPAIMPLSISIGNHHNIPISFDLVQKQMYKFHIQIY